LFSRNARWDMVFMRYEIRKTFLKKKKKIILYSECACFSRWKSSHNGIVIHSSAALNITHLL